MIWFFVSLATSIVGLVTAVITLRAVLLTQQQTINHIIQLEHKTNGRLDELLEEVRKTARQQGFKEGFEARQQEGNQRRLHD